MIAPPLSIRGIRDSLRAPTMRDVVFSSKAYLATALALLAGFSENLENPYWAVLTIYIVLTPPEAGAIRSKALFRFFGTIGGGVVMMALTGLFGDQLGILVSVTIATSAIAVFLKQTDRTPANYVWFSGGITAGVAGLTNLMQPNNVFDSATARMGEISLGILAITAIDSLFWPRPMTDDFLKTMAGWRGQTRDWLVDALELATGHAPEEEWRKAVRQGLRDLTKAVGMIDAKAVQLPFDVVPFAPRGRHLDLVRRQVVELIGDLAAIEVWARSLGRDTVLRTDLGRSLDAVTAWIRDAPDLPGAMIDAHVARGEALVQELAAARDAIDPDEGRTMLVERGLLSRLIAFVGDWSDMSMALRAVATGKRLPARLEQIAHGAKPVRSTDYLGAALDVAPMVLSMSVTTLIWYLTAWSSGSGALLFSFIGCVFLIGQGQIVESSIGLLLLILTAFAFVFLYQYAILPRVTDFPVLIAVLGCAMLPLGLLMAMSMAGMMMCVFIFSFLGLQNAYAADFNTSLQTLSASLVGLLIAVTSLYVCSYDRSRFAARRLVAAVWRDIYDLARSRRVPSRQRFLLLAVDRLALYFPAAELVAAGGPFPRRRMIDDFGIGLNLLALRQHEPKLAPGVQATIRTLRTAAADAYRSKIAGQTDDEAFADAVDAAIGDPAIRAEPAHDELLQALTGLNLALEDVRIAPPDEAMP